MPTAKKKKLDILGGGIGSLTAAWWLTSQPNWKDLYESITVYQTGWRLGGKCASGRGPQGRIEEHGLHIWFGFYDNSFDIIRTLTRCWIVRQRAPGHLVRRLQEAWLPGDRPAVPGAMAPLRFNFPLNGRVPGRDAAELSLWKCIRLTIDFIVDHVERSRAILPAQRGMESDEDRGVLQRLRPSVGARIDDVKLLGMSLWSRVLLTLVKIVDEFGDNIANRSEAEFLPVVNLLREFRYVIRQNFAEKLNVDLEVHRFLVVIDLATTTVWGLFADRVLFKPDKLDAIDGKDFRGGFHIMGRCRKR
jgi:hypothetical protein